MKNLDETLRGFARLYHGCTLLKQLQKWQLRGQDSNLRPPGYEPDELPAALPRDNIKCKWTLQDSNLRPDGYEPSALTN